MKNFKEIAEQHREKGRFKPVKPHDVPNVAVVSPRLSSDSANVKLKEDLRRWFSKSDPKGDWKRINSKGEAIGPCAREPGEPKPKCMSKGQRAALSKKERASAVRRKRQQDPKPERQGAPINVKSKVGESVENILEKWSQKYKSSINCSNPKGFSQRAHCQSLKKNEEYQEENMEQLDEKNKPTNPELWSRAIAQARAKFDVYPSAYANGWASKWYKEHGGGWKSVKEEVQQEGAVPSTEKVITVKHKTSGKTLRVASHAAEKYKKIGYHAVNEASEVGDDPINKGSQDVVKKGSKTVENKTLDNMKEDAPPIHVRSLYAQTYAKHGKTASQSKAAQELAYRAVEKKHGPEMRKKLSDYHNKNQNESVEIIEAKDEEEYGYEGDMAINQLKTIIRHSEYLMDMMKPDTDLPEWVQSKITLATDYIQTACDYMTSEMNESVEQIDEISDKTLGNYITAARKDRETNKINKSAPDTAQRASANERDKKRIAGMNKAKSYLTPGTAGHAKNQARRAANEEVVVESTEKPPFDPPYKKSQDVVTDKSGAKHTPMSRARDLARQAIKKQTDKNKTSMKEEKSRKAQIIKDVTKKKDKFESDPIITDTTVKTDDLR